MAVIVVSNRVAQAQANEAMTGGLASALLPVVRETGAIWIGSSTTAGSTWGAAPPVGSDGGAITGWLKMGRDLCAWSLPR